MTAPVLRRFGRLRTLLFSPAMREDFARKLPGRGADAVVLDCEDATAPHLKPEARVIVRRLAPELAAAGCAVTVRINAPTSEWFEDDLAEALCPELSAVVVPKIERVAELDELSVRLDALGLRSLGVLVGIETALGVADARPLLAHARVIAGYFGAEDFVADMGGRRTPGNAEVAYARHTVALAGRLAGVPVLDHVVTDLADDDRFIREADEARAMGFAGKLCVHPRQVELATGAFTPSPAEVDRARRLLAAYDEALAGGLGAVSFEGQMIDEPLAAQARRVLSLAEG